MTDHLPECWYYDPANVPAVAVNDGYPCICDRLRACEQRVLIAAREAIRALCHQHPLIWPTDEGAMQALDAAIDALREEKK